MPRQHRVHLDELVRGDRLAAVGEELEVGPVLLEQRRGAAPPPRAVFWSSRLWTTSRMFVGGEVHAELRREAVLRPDEERVVGLLVELLLAEREQPRLALEARRRARSRRRAADRRGPCCDSTYCDTSSTTRKSVAPGRGT